MTEREVRAYHELHSRKTFLFNCFWILFLGITLVLGGWQEIVNHPIEVAIVLISVYIFYFVNKNTHDTVLALVSAVIWGAGVMYFILVVLLPGIAAIPHATTFTALNDAANAFNQINYILR